MSQNVQNVIKVFRYLIFKLLNKSINQCHIVVLNDFNWKLDPILLWMLPSAVLNAVDSSIWCLGLNQMISKGVTDVLK